MNKKNERIRYTALFSLAVKMGAEEKQNKLENNHNDRNKRKHFPFSRFVLSFLIFCHHVLQTARSVEDTKRKKKTENMRYIFSETLQEEDRT